MSRCEVCDRETCPRLALSKVQSRREDFQSAMAAIGMARKDCEAHAVPWRARALAAEAALESAHATMIGVAASAQLKPAPSLREELISAAAALRAALPKEDDR